MEREREKEDICVRERAEYRTAGVSVYSQCSIECGTTTPLLQDGERDRVELVKETAFSSHFLPASLVVLPLIFP